MDDKQTPKLVRPANRIKQKIGHSVNVRDLLKPENVLKGQNAIDAKKGEFIEWAKSDIDHLTQVLNEVNLGTMTHDHLSQITEFAENLRDRGGIFGYVLVSQIAKSLVNYCLTIHVPSAEYSIVIAKHIEGLSTVVRGNIEGSGGMIGIELMSGLNKLVEKYRIQ